MRANIDNPCHRLRDAVPAPLSMRGRHVGHGAVVSFQVTSFTRSKASFPEIPDLYLNCFSVSVA